MDIQKKLNIGKDDLVLEVGSGGEPYRRSDILLDKYYVDEEGYRNWANLKLDNRVMVIADAINMPFKDRSAGYVICNHVVEHVEDLPTLFSELERVAGKGFIGCPTEVYDKIYAPQTHIWFIENINNKLYFRKKRESNFKPDYFGKFFPMLYRVNLKNNAIRLMFKQFRNIFFIEYEWANRIVYEVVDSDKGLLNYADAEEIYKYIKQNTNYRVNKANGSRNMLYQAAKRRLDKLLSPRPRPVLSNQQLEAMLRCPHCTGDLSVTGDKVRCLKCSREYRREKNIIFMLEQK